MTERSEELTFASSGVAGVHYARCWPCMLQQCPGGWHSWADDKDIEHAAKTSQTDPTTAVCGCDCRLRDPEPEPEYDPSEFGDNAPCAECGEVGACAYDSEGRAMIHAVWMDDEDESEGDA